MKSIKFFTLVAMMLLIVPAVFSQGCEDPGEGDGINIFGYIQPQYEYEMAGENGTFTKDEDNSGFYFQRARLGVLGNIPYDFTYYFMMEFSPERGMGINDAIVTYNRFPFAKISAGLFKTPFSAEQTQGCHKLYTINRSKVVEQLAGPIRDTGIMLSGSLDSIAGLKNKSLINYQFAFVNGEGRNEADVDKRKSYVGRLVINPIKYFSIGGSYRFNQYGLDNDKNEITQSVYGIETKFEYDKFRLSGEYLNASGAKTEGGGCSGGLVVIPGETAKKNGYYVMASYMSKWNLEPVIKYETFDVDLDLVDDIESTLTFGINYFFNEWTRLQINYNYNFEETIDVEIPNDAIMIQLQAIIK